MSSPLASLSKEILSNDAARSLAARAIKERVDWIYGYSKYDVEEISAELPDRRLQDGDRYEVSVS
jgi:hypothetical protein